MASKYEAKMKFTKNKSTEKGREFWAHVEAVAQEVRNSPHLFYRNDYNTTAPSNQTERSQETPQATGEREPNGPEISCP